MVTVADTVRDIVNNSLYLSDALEKKIINLSALAREIKPVIEDTLSKRVEEGAIIMALKRLLMGKSQVQIITKKLKKPLEIIVRSKLVEITVINDQFSESKLSHVLSLLQRKQNNYFTTTRGVFETTIIANEEMERELLQIIRKDALVSKLSNLSSITIKHSEELLHTPGFHYLVFKTLALEKVNVIESVSAFTELTIILEDKEVDRAFSLLKRRLS